MKHKVFANRKAHSPEPLGRDHCQSPPYAIIPLLPYLPQNWVIWEPAEGLGFMAKSLREHGYTVISTSLDRGQDFYIFEPQFKWDCIVTNPPWSEKAKWLARCVNLGKPWANLMPSTNQSTIGVQTICKSLGDIECIRPDTRIDFCMPDKGWLWDEVDERGEIITKESQAQIDVHWYTWGLNIGQANVYLSPIMQEKKQFKAMIKAGIKTGYETESSQSYQPRLAGQMPLFG